MCKVNFSLASPQPDSECPLRVRLEDGRAEAGSEKRLKLPPVALSPAWLRGTAGPSLSSLCHGPSSRKNSTPPCTQPFLPTWKGCSLESQGTHSEFWERSAENSQESQAPTPPATFSAPGCGHSPFTRGNPELSSPPTPTQGDPLAKGSDVNPTVLALLLLSLRQ